MKRGKSEKEKGKGKRDQTEGRQRIQKGGREVISVINGRVCHI